MPKSSAACLRVMVFCSSRGRSVANFSANPSRSSARSTPIRLPASLALSIPAFVNSLCFFLFTGSFHQNLSFSIGPTHIRFHLLYILTLGGFGGSGSFHRAG